MENNMSKEKALEVLENMKKDMDIFTDEYLALGIAIDMMNENKDEEYEDMFMEILRRKQKACNYKIDTDYLSKLLLYKIGLIETKLSFYAQLKIEDINNELSSDFDELSADDIYKLLKQRTNLPGLTLSGKEKEWIVIDTNTYWED